MFNPTMPSPGKLPVTVILFAVCGASAVGAQVRQRPVQTEEQKAISSRIGGLRSVPDEQRGETTKQIALDIRKLNKPGIRVGLASSLANLATEGDFGKQTLQEVGTTLAEALKQEPVAGSVDKPASPYITLAQLSRYEHVKVRLEDPQYAAALAKLEADDMARDKADFTLTDLHGKEWTLKTLKGNVVLVNFWATWCPPCRKEIPDLEALYTRFKDKGFVVLGISDEETSKVEPYVASHPMSYPVLLDPGRRVNTLFGVQGIPRTVIYNRTGKLAAEAIDMRTQGQLLALLAKAGLK